MLRVRNWMGRVGLFEDSDSRDWAVVALRRGVCPPVCSWVCCESGLWPWTLREAEVLWLWGYLLASSLSSRVFSLSKVGFVGCDMPLPCTPLLHVLLLVAAFSEAWRRQPRIHSLAPRTPRCRLPPRMYSWSSSSSEQHPTHA